MIVTNDRLLRGVVFGGLVASILGIVLGAALGAIRVGAPAVFALTVPWVAAGACRYGFGGRSSRRTRARATFAAFVIVALGYTGFLAGGWTVERFTGERIDVTRQDLDQGLKSLVSDRTRTGDAGAAVVLDERIRETQALLAMSDAEIEDYLWKQEAQLNVALLAYGKLRVTRGPTLRLGAERDPVELPLPATAGLVLLELLVAMVLTRKGILARR